MEEEDVASDPTPEQELPDQGVALEGKDKALHDTKAELTRKSQELAEIKERFASLEGKVSMLTPPKVEEQAPDPFSFLEDEEFKSKFFDSADNPIKALKQIVNVFSGAMAANNRRIREDIDGIRRSAAPKDELVEELRADPTYAGLDDAALEKIATNRRNTSGKGDLPPRVGGSRVTTPGGQSAANERQIQSWSKKIYGE